MQINSPAYTSDRSDDDNALHCIDLGVALSVRLTGTDSLPEFDEILRVFQEIELIDRVQFKQGFVRAEYGHSSDIFAPVGNAVPDQPLFHGTSADNWSMIECFGLSPAKRRFVQLTTDFG